MQNSLRARYPRLLSWKSVALWCAALWKPVEFVLNWVGVVDTVRAAMDPQHWFYKFLFLPHLGLLVSMAGIGAFVLLDVDGP